MFFLFCGIRFNGVKVMICFSRSLGRGIKRINGRCVFYCFVFVVKKTLILFKYVVDELIKSYLFY